MTTICPRCNEVSGNNYCDTCGLHFDSENSWWADRDSIEVEIFN
jgi:predicted amidophosphoribosyltransferase